MTKSKQEINFKKILAKRILQLDNFYSVSKDLKTKAMFLSQMIQLAKEIDPNLLEEKHEKCDKRLYDIAYDVISSLVKGQLSYYDPIHWMDYIRAKILSYLAKEGLIDDFPEIEVKEGEDRGG